MSPQLIALLLQEIAAQAPALIAAFQKGEISIADQQTLFDAVTNIQATFAGPEWQKQS